MIRKRGQQEGTALIWVLVALVAVAIIIYFIVTISKSGGTVISNINPDTMSAVNQGCKVACLAGSEPWSNQKRLIEGSGSDGKKVSFYTPCSELAKLKANTAYAPVIYDTEASTVASTKITLSQDVKTNIANVFDAPCPTQSS